MIEVLVFETPEEADKYLEPYQKHNKADFEKFKDHKGNFVDLLKEQKRYFATELSAGVKDEYFLRTTLFPFHGHNELFDDLSSLVEGVKMLVDYKSSYNIEPIFYTVNDHSKENQETRY